MFFRGSRYEQVPTREHRTSDGRIVRYKALRRIPDTTGLTQHVVKEGERLDHIAFDAYRDPERFWVICDANGAVHPDEVTERPGRVIDITGSAG